MWACRVSCFSIVPAYGSSSISLSLLFAASLHGPKVIHPIFDVSCVLPKRWKTFVFHPTCPLCYPNDENLRPCQQCCYDRRSVEVHTQSKKLQIDEGHIAQRLQQLSWQGSSSPYAKEKTVLERKFGQFLAKVTVPKSLSSALVNCVVGFFVRKGQSMPIVLPCGFLLRDCQSLS